MVVYGRIRGKNFHTGRTQHTHLFIPYHQHQPAWTRPILLKKKRADQSLSARTIGSQQQVICHIWDLDSPLYFLVGLPCLFKLNTHRFIALPLHTSKILTWCWFCRVLFWCRWQLVRVYYSAYPSSVWAPEAPLRFWFDQSSFGGILTVSKICRWMSPWYKPHQSTRDGLQCLQCLQCLLA